MKTYKTLITIALAGIVVVLGACASNGGQSDKVSRDKAIALMKRDFKATGIAGLERLDEDRVQATCNHSGNNPPSDVLTRLQQEQMATVKFLADGNLMGDWKNGEKIAQNGRGFTWRDKPGNAPGGGCYNCHQIGPNEASFGSIGTSLYQFGKIRGYTAEMQKYVYSKIYNAKAFNLCSEMPRFGYVGALSEAQIKDLVALLMDPESEVNK